MKIKDGIIGFIVGDALGVPVEFESRNELQKNPVVGMREYGTYNQPKGTWSDDTSMTLATMTSIINKKAIDYEDIMDEFCRWNNYGEYTNSKSKQFDIGITTSIALSNYNEEGMSALKSGCDELIHFQRIFDNDLDYINGKGYVVYTLECVIHCLLTTDNYKDAVLKAVNIGEDTDTNAAICGGLAGIYYGYSSIPIDWINSINKIDEVHSLCEKYDEVSCNL